MTVNGNGQEPLSEAAQGALKARRAAARVEAARACEPSESALTRFSRAFEGPSNSGTARIYGAEAKPLTPGERLTAIVERAAEADRIERKRANAVTIDRKRAAEEMRAVADHLERGS